MGRLKQELIDRVDSFCDRVVDVTEALEASRRSRRIIDQLFRSGTSVGANTNEADEAISRPDFCKCLGTARRELNEARFWLRMAARRGWVKPPRLQPLQLEADALVRIFGAIVFKSQLQEKKK